MFGKLGVLLQIAWRNLFASWLNVIIGLVILFGTFLVVVGGSALDSLDRSMSKSITGSVSGDIQVYAASSKDDLEIFGGMMGQDSELDVIPSYEKLEALLKTVPNVDKVVPMGLQGAIISGGNTIDLTLERLRKVVKKRLEGDGSAETAAQIDSIKQHVRHMVGLLERERKNADVLVDQSSKDPAVEEAIARASSEEFWTGFDQDPYAALEFLENQIAPILSDSDLLFIRYMGTDFDRYQAAFDRMQIVDGERVPNGKRGILMPKFVYEEMFKVKTARRLDKIKEGIEEGGKQIATDPELQRFVKENKSQTRDILLQLDPLKTKAVIAGLQQKLGSKEQELDKLLAQLLELDDQNFKERYALFYEVVAPQLELYRVRVGDVITIKAFTRSGYVESVNLPVYGTFNFKGLEKSPLAGATSLIDLVSFRELYGHLTAENRAELEAIKQASGAKEVSREDAEAALFGDSREVVAEATAGIIDEADQFAAGSGADRLQREDLLKRVYEQSEIDQGMVLNAAVMLKDPSKLEETQRAIEEASKQAGLPLKAASWQQAAGIIGQFVQYVRYALYAIATIIFLVAMVILSNAVLMATLQRVREIGTMRAIGAQRGFVRAMIVVETLALGTAFGGIGLLLGAGLITWIGSAGIPATTEELYFFFAGPKWHPTVSLSNVIVAYVIVLVVSVISTLYPALVATRVNPVTAMSAAEE